VSVRVSVTVRVSLAVKLTVTLTVTDTVKLISQTKLGGELLAERRVPGLSYGVVCVIPDLTIFVELRLVTDGRTDGGQTDRHTYRVALAQLRVVKISVFEALRITGPQKFILPCIV